MQKTSGLLSVALERNSCTSTVDGRKVSSCQLKLQRATERPRGGWGWDFWKIALSTGQRQLKVMSWSYVYLDVKFIRYCVCLLFFSSIFSTIFTFWSKLREVVTPSSLKIGRLIVWTILITSTSEIITYSNVHDSWITLYFVHSKILFSLWSNWGICILKFGTMPTYKNRF